jgi:hypothetical protein
MVDAADRRPDSSERTPVSPDLLFTPLNGVAVLSWIALAGMPRKRWVTHGLTAVWVPAVCAAVYTVVVAATFWKADGNPSSLTGVGELLREPWMVLAATAHYLTFDLLIGSWEVRDAQKHGVPHLLVVPCLFLTMLFGPAGWLAYLGVRLARGVRRPGHGLLAGRNSP